MEAAQKEKDVSRSSARQPEHSSCVGEMLDPDALITEYKEKIAEEGKSGYANSKMNELIEKAKISHRRGNYSDSYDCFAHALAILESDPKAKTPDEMHATMLANIASSLHFLGHLELAKVRVEFQRRDGFCAVHQESQVVTACVHFVLAEVLRARTGRVQADPAVVVDLHDDGPHLRQAHRAHPGPP